MYVIYIYIYVCVCIYLYAYGPRRTLARFDLGDFAYLIFDFPTLTADSPAPLP